ncbi:MAG: hypothetical protein ACTSU5_21590 [Promethearchaeota archaeon]
MEAVDGDPRPQKKDWSVVGVHRLLGGYWHNFSLDLGSLILGFLMLGVFLPLVLPYSETLGFQSVVSSLFALTFTLFDMGVGNAVSRFVAERSARDPRGAVRYVQFFIWFQMITGLVQITAIGLYVLTWIPQTNMAYLAWFMLAYSTIQFPGMLGIYSSALKGFQRYNKANIVNFVQNSLLQTSTQLICVLLGRWWGALNPQYGDMWGATIGWIVGAYLDDFLAMVLAAKMFEGVLKDFGLDLRLRDTLRVQFTRQEAVDCLKFGAKVVGSAVAGNIYSLISTIIFVAVIPAYATWIGLLQVADIIARFVSKCELPINAPFAEAYLNGKRELARYYLAYQWKHYGMMTGMWLVLILFLATPMLGIVGDVFGNYGAAALIIPLLMLSRTTVSTIHFSDGVMLGADKPEAVFYALLIQRSVGMFFRYLFLVVFKLGWVGIPLADAIEFNTKVVFAWWFIHTKILRVRIPWWQSFGASSLAGTCLAGVCTLLLRGLFYPLLPVVGAITAAAVVLVLGLFALPVLVYFPLYGIFGGWDAGTLEDFQSAMEISGPSKPLVFLFYHATRLGARVSPLTDRFPVPLARAREEARELQERQVKVGN